ncbi:MAG: EscU/YscU/HrcU family type III secretion system export apparatus switch protein [Spirochaetia bacterium]|nr:EscU/YscU/HrcU family type III secretion system export apparatus switch protein [Spirochaetia bacterium]
MNNTAEKILKACALEYNENLNAPLVRAYGEGMFAEKIIEFAEKHGITIKKDETEELLTILKNTSIDAEIPVEIYVAISRIYASIYNGAINK